MDTFFTSARVTFYRNFDGKPCVYTDYDIIIPLKLDLASVLAFAQSSAEKLLLEEDDFDNSVEICDVMVSFRKSHQSAEDPSVLP